ncbi:phosphodiester glycosidase family protein [Allocoleopsis sp.]|uniref:phosphodiester glycosidase family protein n=1 Tax=Allocoleopsis sp. TaxID=3088169 RepID=UPI002FCE71CD
MSKRARPETRRADCPRGDAKGKQASARLRTPLENRKDREDRIVWATISRRTIVLFVLSLVGSSLALASANVETPESPLLQRRETRLNQPPVLTKETLPPPQVAFVSEVSPVLTQQNTKPSGDKPLLSQVSSVSEKANALRTLKKPSASRPVPLLSQVSPKVARQGTQVSLNGQIYTAAWRQWQVGASVRTAISDVGLMQNLGMELLSTRDFARQPIQWFSDPTRKPLVLATQLGGAYRYLDISDFAKMAGWRLQVAGDKLQITSVPARLKDIQQGPQAWGSRIIIDLDRPTPWRVSDRVTEGVITLDASADPALMDRFKAPPPQPSQPPQEIEDVAPVPVKPQSDLPVLRVENAQNQTTIRVQIPEGKRIQVFSVPNPNRLVIDLRPDALLEKEILWAPGIRWRQQYVNLGQSRFPVVWLEVDPRVNRMSFRPIWSNPATQVGTAPLIQTAQLWQAAAAINAGFFNRKQQLPLGAIRRDGRWFSGPILNRGAIAWNETGQFKIGRLSLQETLATSTGMSLPVLFLNSGYVKAGISRYTPEWGPTYTPLTDNEILVFVQNNQVTGQMPGGIVGQSAFPIPTDGYLLTLRGDGTSAASFLGVGTQVRLGQSTTPTDFASYPQILGAGPLLVQNRQIVLDAKAEQFSDAFSQQMAIRSAIATTTTGTLMIAAIHSRVGGRGPSLAETAQLLQQMGAINALNFDGGSSTGLYLGGQLLDRSPYTASRVHNALGLFLAPLP